MLTSAAPAAPAAPAGTEEERTRAAHALLKTHDDGTWLAAASSTRAVQLLAAVAEHHLAQVAHADVC